MWGFQRYLPRHLLVTLYSLKIGEAIWDEHNYLMQKRNACIKNKK